MAGGTWIDQNKLKPGVYINYKSKPATLVSMGERGVVAISHEMDWGKEEELVTIETPEDCRKLGYDINAPEMLFVRQIFLGSNRTNGAKKILVWRPSKTGAAAASFSGNGVVATAKYKGDFGNKIKIVVSADPDNDSTTGYTFYVQTVVNGEPVDTQVFHATTSSVSAAGIVDNDYVLFSSQQDTPLSDNSISGGSSLTGGLNGTGLTSTTYSNFLSALERYPFDVLIYDGDNATLKEAVCNFVKRLSNDEGARCQCVVSNLSGADSECVISCALQSLRLQTGEVLTPEQVTWWVGGASAGANVNESLSYAVHTGAVEIMPKLTSSEQDAAVNSGTFAFIEQFGKVQCLTDINTFKTFSVEKGKAFSKNRVVRVVFGLCNDIHKTFTQYYVGGVHNDEEGRKALKAEILSLMYKYQGNRALQNVIVDDVEVKKGADSDAVLIEVNCQPVDSIEKIYVNITIS